MSKRKVTTTREFLDILHGPPRSNEDIQREKDARSLRTLEQLHKEVGERIATVERVHEEGKSEVAQKIAVGMLDIQLHKEMRHIEGMIEEQQQQHDALYNTYTQLERRERFKQERKKSLVEKLGPKDAAAIISIMEKNDTQATAREEQRKELKRKLSLT